MTGSKQPITMPPLFSDGAVLQRDTALKIWGRGAAGEPLRISFAGTWQTVVDHEGKWEIKLPPRPAGGPFQLRVAGYEEVVLSNIYVGDVYLLSGQSNMELPISRTLDLYAQEAPFYENPQIRQFTVPMAFSFQGPQSELKGGVWQSADPQTVLGFSALGYFYAQALFEKYRLPVGLILAAAGGTPIEAWLSAEVLATLGDYEDLIRRCQDEKYLKSVTSLENKRWQSWHHQLGKEDAGLEGRRRLWAYPGFDHSIWPQISVPQGNLPQVSGSIWLRKDILVPAHFLGQSPLLRLGALIDADETYLNGLFLGRTDYKYPPRRYTVPAGVLRAGHNTLAVRLISREGRPRFVWGKKYALAAGPYELDLSGLWYYKIGARLHPLAPFTFFQNKPSGLYNGMIAPLHPFPLKGVLWYQGESNAHEPRRYKELFQALIASWRRAWQNPGLPFLYVQLPNFEASQWEGMAKFSWAKLREAQRQALAVPHTAMAVAIDVGEENDLHPQNKKAVGQRLALLARRHIYGEELTAQGPLFTGFKIKGPQVEIEFETQGSGLVSRGGALSGFEVCAKDKKFFPATAKIEGNKVVLRCQEVAQPLGVRYAWADNPQGANLYNQAGLPAAPFQAFLPAKENLGEGGR